jgi:hypothetical protein
LADTVIVVAFAYVLLRPISNNALLMGSLGLIAVASLSRASRRRRHLHPLLVSLGLAQFAFGVWGAVVGAVRGAPGLSHHVVIYLAVPAAYWALVMAADEVLLRRLFRTIVWTTMATSVVIVLYVLANKGALPQLVPQSLLQQAGAGFGSRDGSTQIRFFSIGTLIAAGPICVGSLFVSSHARCLPPMAERVAASILVLLAGFTAGRRALVLALVLAPIAALLLRRLLDARPVREVPRRLPLLSGFAVWALLLCGVVGGSAAGLVSFKIVEHATEGAFAVYLPTTSVDGPPDQGNVLYGESDSVIVTDAGVRRVQAKRLIDEWSHHPLTGAGFGATIDGYARNADAPWEFELQYHLLLMQTGLVGIAVLVVVAVAARRAVVAAARRSVELRPAIVAASVGAVMMLFSNASNPYLQAPGHLWSLYLPLAIVNVALARPGRSAPIPEGVVRPEGAVHTGLLQ